MTNIEERPKLGTRISSIGSRRPLLGYSLVSHIFPYNFGGCHKNNIYWEIEFCWREKYTKIVSKVWVAVSSCLVIISYIQYHFTIVVRANGLTAMIPDQNLRSPLLGSCILSGFRKRIAKRITAVVMSICFGQTMRHLLAHGNFIHSKNRYRCQSVTASTPLPHFIFKT